MRTWTLDLEVKTENPGRLKKEYKLKRGSSSFILLDSMNVKEALSRSDKELWLDAMETEYKTH